jgi:hypothetical protein
LGVVYGLRDCVPVAVRGEDIDGELVAERDEEGVVVALEDDDVDGVLVDVDGVLVALEDDDIDGELVALEDDDVDGVPVALEDDDVDGELVAVRDEEGVAVAVEERVLVGTTGVVQVNTSRPGPIPRVCCGAPLPACVAAS